jgi:hypothetical protein
MFNKMGVYSQWSMMGVTVNALKNILMYCQWSMRLNNNQVQQ